MSVAAVIAAGATCGTFAFTAAAAPLTPAHNPLGRLTADQIAKKAAADLKAASSFHFHGSARESGQTYSISMSVTHQGCTGSLGAGRDGSLALLVIGKAAWIQPSDKFWEVAGVPASELPLVHGKWLEVTGTGSNSLSAAVAPLCNPSKLVSALAPHLTGLIKGKTIKISRHPALQLRNSSGKESIYVSISSKPEILRIINDDTLNFSAYGAHVTLTPPPASDVISLPSGSLAAHSLQHVLRGM